MKRAAVVLIGAELALAASIGAAGLVGLSGRAYAQPTETVTVDGVDYPVCSEEDCSDQSGQVGVWTNRDGVSYLELGESRTYRIWR